MSGYALLKKPLGGPWNAQKEIQETGKRFKEIGKNTYGPPHVGSIGATNISAIPALQPLKRHCKSAPRHTYTNNRRGPKPAARPPNSHQRRNVKNNSKSILYPPKYNNDNNTNKSNKKNVNKATKGGKNNSNDKHGQTILCIGDSFTSGYRGKNLNGENLKKSPYFKFLESRLLAEAQKGEKPRYKQWDSVNIMYDASSDETLKDIKARLIKNVDIQNTNNDKKNINVALPLTINKMTQKKMQQLRNYNNVNNSKKMKRNNNNNNNNNVKQKKQQQRLQRRKLPDIVILFAGLNDLILSSKAEHGKQIIDDLLAILSTISTLKIKKCILCTIPKIPKEINNSIMQRNRIKLNEAIRSMNEINIFPIGSVLGTEPATRIVICNVAKEIDSDNAKHSLLTWSNDGVHMKRHGYERIANYISQTLIKTSTMYMRYKVGREKYEREKKKQEIKLRKKHAIESEKQEEERLKVIHHEAEVKRKKELKKKAMAAGSPARENRWMRIADEESRSFESYFMREAEKLRLARQREKERKDTELMEEEDRLVRVYVRHLKKLAREEAKLVKIDNKIIKLVSKRVYITKPKLLASLFAVLPYPVPGKVLQSRIKGLFLKKKLERDKNFPEIIFHRPAMEEHFRAKKEKEEEERKKLHAESLAAVKKKALKTAEDNKMESYAERLARLGRDNL